MKLKIYFPKNKGFTLLELIISMSVIAIILGMALPLMTGFSQRRDVDAAVLQVLQDLRQAQQFARTSRDSYSYYGITFLSGLGQNSNRTGYRIVRFEPQTPVLPITDFSCPVANKCTIIKSSVAANNPEFLEDTFFPARVTIDSAGEIKVGDTIVFTPQGSVTTDGQTLLPANKDQITISGVNNSKTLTIQSLTGYVKVQ